MDSETTTEQGGWKKPTKKEKLQEAHEFFNLPKVKRRKKIFDWWDKVKISLYEDKAKADFEVIEPKQLPPPDNNQKQNP